MTALMYASVKPVLKAHSQSVRDGQTAHIKAGLRV